MIKKPSAINTPLIILTLITSNIILIANASPQLALTIQTDKEIYDMGDALAINGTLTKDGTPASDALIALQIVDPAGYSFIYRTLTTGIEPQGNWMIEILDVTPCDGSGNPKTSFRRGETANIKVKIRNNGDQSEYVLLVLNSYYLLSHETPFKAILYFQGTIPPGTLSFIPQIVIPEDAPICTSKVYANAYKELPENVGYAYCPERSATFNIVSSTTSSSSQKPEGIPQEGTYNCTFAIPNKYVRLGNYTAYVGTLYQREQAFAYTTFEVVLLGDINGDKIVDLFDAVLLSAASGSQPGDSHWDPRCDINNDEVVDIFDAVILSSNAGKIAL